MNDRSPVPVVLVFAGSDPSGGAGVQADIESIASMGCHATCVITAITVQDTEDVARIEPVDAMTVMDQARAVLEDIPVAATKVGLIGPAENAEAIHAILMDYPELPVVLDPVIESGGGSVLTDDETAEAMVNLLFPLTTVVTPNTHQVTSFAPEGDNLESRAQEILEYGCEFLLITGTHENTRDVVNTLYGHSRQLETYTWERLPFSYHGSGCTLSAAISGLLAQGIDPYAAFIEAQEYTWDALKQGYRIGMGQHLPNRFFWAHGEEAQRGEAELDAS